MKENFDLKMQETIATLGERKRLLLHVCCAPCSTSVLERLQPYFDIGIYFYNPNMDSQTEFDRRLTETRRLIQRTGLAKEVIETGYDSQDFFEAIQGLEKEKEGGLRCQKCFALRLTASARYAKTHGFDFFTTTLTVSPRKDARILNQLGNEIAKREGVAFLPSDFKKRSGYLRSVQLSKEHDLYRQDYCGCIFSKAERLSQLKNKTEGKD